MTSISKNEYIDKLGHILISYWVSGNKEDPKFQVGHNVRT